MKNKWLLVVLLFVSLGVKAQETEQLFYYLKVSTANVEVNCYVNGFPVYDISSHGQVINQVPINLALIGKGNELEVVAKPLGPNAFVSGGISPYGGGEMVSSDDERSGVLKFDFRADKEVRKTFEFDNERYDYSQVLVESPVIRDIERLRDYGVKLQALIAQKKNKELIDEMKPKIEATAIAFSVEPSIMYENMQQVLSDNIFTTNWQKVERQEIVPKSFCKGKVWELSTADNKPLIYAEEDGGSTQMAIYVAEVDGELRVVR